MDGDTLVRGDISGTRLVIFLVACTGTLLLVPMALFALQVGQDAVFTADFVVAMLFMMLLWRWNRPQRAS